MKWGSGMFLYKIECDSNKGAAVAIILAADDEAAFSAAEVHVMRHYIAMPEIRSMTIVEKKRVEKGSGYIIETA
jgi:hypothetical protein